MGRGIGPIQKKIVMALKEHQKLNVESLSGIVYKIGLGKKPARSQMSSIYKGVLALERRGMIMRSPDPTIYGDLGWMLVSHPTSIQQAPKRRLSVVTPPR